MRLQDGFLGCVIVPGTSLGYGVVGVAAVEGGGAKMSFKEEVGEAGGLIPLCQ